MTKEKGKMTYDLGLSHEIFQANILSLYRVSKASLGGQSDEHELLINHGLSESIAVDWVEKNSHYANIDWLVLNSALISLFSIFEYHIFQLVKIVEERGNYKIKLSDFSGNGIFKYCNYLFLVGGIASANKQEGDWQKILSFQKVRNLIAHNGGMILLNDSSKKLESDALYKFLKENDIIVAGELGHIRIRNLKFIELFCKLSVILSNKITNDITGMYK
jgi:hypothetical protein